MLGDKLGPILFQLPPRWRVNIDRLAAYPEWLPAGHRYAFEFRDPGWSDDDVYRLLERDGAALCAWDLDHRQSPVRVTAPFAYVRLHGPGGPYQGSNDDAALAAWARHIRGWRDAGLDIHCHFDNDEAGYAPADAARLAAMRDVTRPAGAGSIRHAGAATARGGRRSSAGTS